MEKKTLKYKKELLKKFNKKPSFREEANVLTYHCFRNSFIEDIHAGTSPSSKLRDYSDVKVISPFGEILWNDLSRISDEEMKKLMIETSAELAHFLQFKKRHPKKYRQIINLFSSTTLKDWEKKARKYNIKKEKSK